MFAALDSAFLDALKLGQLATRFCHTMIHMARDLLPGFCRENLDDGELQVVLQRHFQSGGQAGVRDIVYPGQPAEYAIKLVFSKDDNLKRIEAGPALTIALETQLRSAVEDAHADTGYRVFREVVFADYQLRGSWRYKDWFQVLPVPETAPRLTSVFGDHPFVLEVRVLCSKDGSITTMRVAKAMRDVRLLLCGLVNTSIHSLATRPFYGHWVNLPGEAHDHVAYLYPHYPAVNTSTTIEFSSAEAPASVLPPLRLFGPWELNAGAPLSFPEGFADLLTIYETLGRDQKAQLLRSCYWLQRANRSFVESFSSAFMSVVTATEALFDSANRQTCRSCGQRRYSLATSFSQFLENHVPLANLTNRAYGKDSSFEARLKHLYRTRSQITHGSDIRGWGGGNHGFTPRANQDDDDLRTLLRIMPYALGTWLSRQPLPPPPGKTSASSLRERTLRWLAARTGRLHDRLLRACDNLGTKRAQRKHYNPSRYPRLLVSIQNFLKLCC